MQHPILPAALAAALAATAAASPAAADGPVVVELFTSQGCSSCPPADAWLNELSARGDVIALSMHVDYWDYLGWRDTFASEETTARQFAYRDAHGGQTVWTPQVVVQGAGGSMAQGSAAFDAAISEALRSPNGIALSLEGQGGMLHCVAALAPGAEVPPGAMILVVTYEREARVRIERGENGGREITYRNVVRGLSRLGTWDGSLPLNMPVPQPGPGEGVAVILQSGPAGPILAATRLEN